MDHGNLKSGNARERLCVRSHGHLMRDRWPLPHDSKPFNPSSHPHAGITMTCNDRAAPVPGCAQSFTLIRNHLGNIDREGALEVIPLTGRNRVDSCLQ
jgi:hypothetical protein